MKLSGNITPCLWFDTQAEEAANFYCSVFENAKVGKISRYPRAGQEVRRKPPGSVMVVEFEINGQTFTALNGGPNYKFNEAVKKVLAAGSRTNLASPGRSSLRRYRR